MLNFVNENENKNNEYTGIDSYEDLKSMFNKVAFGGERVLFELDGANVAIVPFIMHPKI